MYSKNYFLYLFTEQNYTLKSLKNIKGLRDELSMLQKKALKSKGNKQVELMDQISWIKDKIKQQIK